MISFLVPTRNRPYNCFRFLETLAETQDLNYDVEVLFYIDEDDQSVELVREACTRENVHIHIGPRVNLGDTHTILAQYAKGDILGYAGDDIKFVTAGWNKFIEDEFIWCPDQLLLVYPNDLINEGRIAAHGFVSRKHYELLGYVTPSYPARFSDVHLQEIYHNLGRLQYLPDVVLEHLHYIVGKADLDETMENNNKRDIGADRLWYNNLQNRINDCQKLLEYLDEYHNTNSTIQYKAIL